MYKKARLNVSAVQLVNADESCDGVFCKNSMYFLREISHQLRFFFHPLVVVGRSRHPAHFCLLSMIFFVFFSGIQKKMEGDIKCETKVNAHNFSDWCKNPDRVFQIIHRLYMWQIIEQDLKRWIQPGKVFYLLFASMDALFRMINDEPKPEDKCTTEVLGKDVAQKKMPSSVLLKSLTNKKWGLLIGHEKDDKEICVSFILYEFPSKENDCS